MRKDWETIAEMQRNGVSFRQICQEIGLSRKSAPGIQRGLKRLGKLSHVSRLELYREKKALEAEVVSLSARVVHLEKRDLLGRILLNYQFDKLPIGWIEMTRRKGEAHGR